MFSIPLVNLQERAPLQLPTICQACQETKEKILRCSKCLWTGYCNSVCQRADWPQHKLICKEEFTKYETYQKDRFEKRLQVDRDLNLEITQLMVEQALFRFPPKDSIKEQQLLTEISASWNANEFVRGFKLIDDLMKLPELYHHRSFDLVLQDNLNKLLNQKNVEKAYEIAEELVLRYEQELGRLTKILGLLPQFFENRQSAKKKIDQFPEYNSPIWNKKGNLRKQISSHHERLDAVKSMRSLTYQLMRDISQNEFGWLCETFKALHEDPIVQSEIDHLETLLKWLDRRLICAEYFKESKPEMNRLMKSRIFYTKKLKQLKKSAENL